MTKLIDNFVLFLHIIFIILAIVIPFTNSNYFLMIYSITVPFIFVHWICQDNTCMITVVEKYLRKQYLGETDEDCISCKLIEPVYDFPKIWSNYRTLIYVVTCGLLTVAISKLGLKYYRGDITKFSNLFAI